METRVRPDLEARSQVEDPSRVGGRREEPPVVIVQALLEAQRRAVEAAGVVSGKRRAMPLQGQLFERSFGKSVRVDPVDRRALGNRWRNPRREHRDVAVRFGLVPIFDDDVECHRRQRDAVDDEGEATVEGPARQVTRKHAEGRARPSRSAAANGVVAGAVPEGRRPVLLVEILHHQGVSAVREVIGLPRDRPAHADPEVVGLVKPRERAGLPHFLPATRRSRHDVDRGGGHDVDEVAAVEGRAADVVDADVDRRRHDGDVIAVVVYGKLDRRALRRGVLEPRFALVRHRPFPSLGGRRRALLALVAARVVLGAPARRSQPRQVRRVPRELVENGHDEGILGIARCGNGIASLVEPLHVVAHRARRDVAARNESAPTSAQVLQVEATPLLHLGASVLDDDAREFLGARVFDVHGHGRIRPPLRSGGVREVSVRMRCSWGRLASVARGRGRRDHDRHGERRRSRGG